MIIKAPTLNDFREFLNDDIRVLAAMRLLISTMLSLWALVLLSGHTFLLQGSLAQQPHYVAVAPAVIRPNSDYNVAVTTSFVSEPTTVYAEITGKKFSGGSVFIQEFINVQPYVTRTLTLKVKELGEGQYNLTIRSDRVPFFNTTELRYSPKSHSVFIQTDKAVYKPGDKVQFRAIFLNPYLKPLANQQVNLYLTDGEGNRVKQWSNVTTNRVGVFSANIELSSSPVLGDWMLVTNVEGEQFSKQFEVAEYVLPKFEVSVDLPPYVTFKDSKFPATIRAKYTYGKPVKGEATVSVYSEYFSDIIQPIFKQPIIKIIQIDGKGVVEFDLAKELALPDDYEREVKFDVTVKEDLTGRKQNTTAKMIIRKHKYKLEMINTRQIFKPTLRHDVFIRLIHYDGTPVIDKTNKIKIRTAFNYNEEDFNSTEYDVPASGVLELSYTPDANTTAIVIEGSYLDVKEYFPTITSAVTTSKAFLKAYLITKEPKVNEDIEIEVNCTEEMTYLTYQVLGRGNIVLANTVSVPRQKTARWRFLATYSMAPDAHILVEFINANMEVISDLIHIELGNAMQNFVQLNVNPDKSEPGANINIRVATKPNSYVGLLAVDQSVLLLKSGNDIMQETVVNELKTYDPVAPIDYSNDGIGSGSRPFFSVLGRKKREMDSEDKRTKRSIHLPYYSPDSMTTQDTFDNAGVVVLTNAEVNAITPWNYRVKPPGMGERPAVAPGARRLKPDIGPPVAYRPATRPPLAGPYAFSRLPRPIWNRPRYFLSSDYPANTWLFTQLSTGFDGKGSISKPAPDTITSWVISAFSLDNVFGLGLLEKPHKLTVFRPFFISMNLPYSVIRGESVSIPVVVFNYMDSNVNVDVTMENGGQFEFADFSNEVAETPKVELFRRKTIVVPKQSGVTTSFMITAKELGYIDLKVTATSPLAGDSVIRKLLVKPEGETIYKSKAVFIDLRESNNFKTNFTLDIPENIVADSKHIEIAAVGDILGPSINNLDHLIKMPFGCGEQNMLNFVPNIVVLKYLQNTNQLNKAIESKSLNYMEKGYQRELTYKHEDGSFSAFGKSDKSGSTWLTAFVAKSFIQAKSFILIDEEVVLSSLKWLSDHQSPNGSFQEVGSVSHKEMQGGAANGIALTAYVLTAFLEGSTITDRYTNTINKAVSYLNSNMDDNTDTYSLAVVAYALTHVGHPSATRALALLDKTAKSKDGMKWWQRANIEKSNPNDFIPNSIDVEMTSYAMLAYMKRDLVSECIPLMKWLVTQQNEDGGFASTQDTVMALTALSELGSKISSKNVDITATFTYKEGMSSDIRINQGNTMIHQKLELPKKVEKVNITATGRGFAIAQILYRYNVNVTGAWPLFTLDPQVDKNSDNNHLQLSICSGFTGGNESNMAVMEIALPSGYTVDSDSLPSLEISQNVKKVETRDGDTVVVLYFDKMTAKEYCPTVSAFRTHRVARQKPVPVTVYDYYDQSRRARVFYEPLVATLCDICEGEDCRVCSGSKAGTRSDEKGAACMSIPSLNLIFLSLLSYYYFYC